MSDFDRDYFIYLRSRSFLGYIYRRFVIYPRLNKRCQGKVLDYGCGIGDFLSFSPSAIGVDVNAFCVDFCVSKKLNAISIDSGAPLPFGNDYFDTIVMDNVLEHIADPDFVLNEFGRVLKPGGKLIVGVPGIKGFEQDTDHKVFYGKRELSSLLVERGSYSLLEWFHTPFEFPYASQLLKRYCLFGCFVRL